jgi:hypothetical protein
VFCLSASFSIFTSKKRDKFTIPASYFDGSRDNNLLSLRNPPFSPKEMQPAIIWLFSTRSYCFHVSPYDSKVCIFVAVTLFLVLWIWFYSFWFLVFPFSVEIFASVQLANFVSVLYLMGEPTSSWIYIDGILLKERCIVPQSVASLLWMLVKKILVSLGIQFISPMSQRVGPSLLLKIINLILGCWAIECMSVAS